MIVFLDTEFSGLHQGTTLMSLALLAHQPTNPKVNGRCFYAELIDYDHNQLTPWLQEHVVDHFLLNDLRPELRVPGVSSPLDASASVSRVSEFSEFGTVRSEFCLGTKSGVAAALRQWLEQFLPEVGPGGITIVADVPAYDWVLFCDLLSTYEDGYPSLPPVVHYLPLDFATLLAAYGLDPDLSRHHFCGPAQLEDYDTLLLPMPVAGAQHNALADTVQLRQGFVRLAAQNDYCLTLPHGDVFRFDLVHVERAALLVRNQGQTDAIWVLSMAELGLINNLLDSVFTSFEFGKNAHSREARSAQHEFRPLDSSLVIYGVSFWLCVVADLRDHDPAPRALVRNTGRSEAVLPEYGTALSLVYEFMDAPARLPSAFGQLYANASIRLLSATEAAAGQQPGADDLPITSLV